MVDAELQNKIMQFIEQEAHSCSMDFDCLPLEYVYCSLGGQVQLYEIESALRFQNPRFMCVKN